MNKKILALAFVSAAFLFGCTADGSFDSDTSPTPTPGGGTQYCYIENECVPFEGALTAEMCRILDGTVVNSCPR